MAIAAEATTADQPIAAPDTAASDMIVRTDTSESGALSSIILSSHEIHSCLLVNVHVYALADKLEMCELMDLAVEKFKVHVKTWPQYDFAAIVAEVLDSTPSNDQGLRPVIAEVCASNLSKMLSVGCSVGPSTELRAQWAEVLKKDSDFLFTLFQKSCCGLYILMDKKDDANTELVAAMEDMKEKRDEVQEEKDELNNNFGMYRLHVDRLLSTVTSINKCRHCGADFQPKFEPTVEQYEDRPNRLLRCSRCRTRHHY